MHYNHSRQPAKLAAKMAKRKMLSWRLQFSLVVLVFAGCQKSGPAIAPVSGRVTLDGRPLATADVVFQPDGAARASYGRTDADGRYQLGYKRGVPGALVGQHTVQISVSHELVRNPPTIAPRYNSQSELRADVIPNTENVFDFDLTSAAK
jgi:hypothetical protein